jgi:hypothetical protein
LNKMPSADGVWRVVYVGGLDFCSRWRLRFLYIGLLDEVQRMIVFA